MNCHYCQGIDTYRDVKKRYFSSTGAKPFLLENMPFSECVQCGEQVLSGSAMDALDSIHDGHGAPVSFAMMPIYDYDNLTGHHADRREPIIEPNILKPHLLTKEAIAWSCDNLVRTLSLWSQPVPSQSGESVRRLYKNMVYSNNVINPRIQGGYILHSKAAEYPMTPLQT